jgi:hypothetical protein
MSDATCSCRLPWLTAAACAFALGAVLAVPRPAAPPTTAPTPATPVSDAIHAELRQELADLRRAYDDAQSGLAQRDREIAAAADELRTLRASAPNPAAGNTSNPEQRQALINQMRESNRKIAASFHALGSTAFVLEWPEGPVGWATIDREQHGVVCFWGRLPAPAEGTRHGVWIYRPGQPPTHVGDLNGISALTFTVPPTSVIEGIGIHRDRGSMPGPLIVAGSAP